MTKYFTNNFTVTNLYKKPSIKSEIVTQMIYGDSFSIYKKGNKWLKIRIIYVQRFFEEASFIISRIVIRRRFEEIGINTPGSVKQAYTNYSRK